MRFWTWNIARFHIFGGEVKTAVSVPDDGVTIYFSCGEISFPRETVLDWPPDFLMPWAEEAWDRIKRFFRQNLFLLQPDETFRIRHVLNANPWILRQRLPARDFLLLVALMLKAGFRDSQLTFVNHTGSVAPRNNRLDQTSETVINSARERQGWEKETIPRLLKLGQHTKVLIQRGPGSRHWRELIKDPRLSQ